MTRTLVSLFIATVFSVCAHATDTPNLQEARMVPVVKTGGKVDGFKFVDVHPASVYAKNGLKKNDVLKSVNGELIDGPEKAMRLADALKTDKVTKVVIERGGQEQEMTLKGTTN